MTTVCYRDMVCPHWRRSQQWKTPWAKHDSWGWDSWSFLGSDLLFLSSNMLLKLNDGPAMSSNSFNYFNYWYTKFLLFLILLFLTFSNILFEARKIKKNVISSLSSKPCILFHLLLATLHLPGKICPWKPLALWQFWLCCSTAFQDLQRTAEVCHSGLKYAQCSIINFVLIH